MRERLQAKERQHQKREIKEKHDQGDVQRTQKIKLSIELTRKLGLSRHLNTNTARGNDKHVS